jgi:hypothetical protein
MAAYYITLGNLREGRETATYRSGLSTASPGIEQAIDLNLYLANEIGSREWVLCGSVDKRE